MAFCAPLWRNKDKSVDTDVEETNYLIPGTIRVLIKESGRLQHSRILEAQMCLVAGLVGDLWGILGGSL